MFNDFFKLLKLAFIAGLLTGILTGLIMAIILLVWSFSFLVESGRFFLIIAYTIAYTALLLGFLFAVIQTGFFFLGKLFIGKKTQLFNSLMNLLPASLPGVVFFISAAAFLLFYAFDGIFNLTVLLLVVLCLAVSFFISFILWPKLKPLLGYLMEHGAAIITMVLIFILTAVFFWLTVPSAPYPGYDAYSSQTSGLFNSPKTGNRQVMTRQLEKQPMADIILITIETTRADHLGAYGYHRDTSPNIDEFATENIRFDKCRVQSPATVVNLTGLLTSAYPGESGVYAQNQTLSNEWETITETLKKNGYYTIGVIANHLLPKNKGIGTAQGFDEYVNLRKSPASIVSEEAKARIKDCPRPFFFWVHYFDPHTPYNPPEAFFNKVRNMNKPLDKNPVLPLIDYGSWGGVNLKRVFTNEYRPSNKSKGVRKRYIYDLYDSEILYVDAEIGKLLSFLKDNNLYENSLIILTSDHGECLAEHDLYCQHCLNLYRGPTEVPLMIHLPGYINEGQGQVVEEPVSSIDITPTILDVLGIPQPDRIRGMSLLPFLQEEVDFKTTDMILMTGWWDGLSLKLRKMPDQHPDFAIISGSYKYIIHSMEAYMVAYPWELLHFWRNALSNRLKADEMYDLAKDPLETINLRDSDRETAERLKKALFDSQEFSIYVNQRIKNETNKIEQLTEKQKEKLKSLGYL